MKRVDLVREIKNKLTSDANKNNKVVIEEIISVINRFEGGFGNEGLIFILIQVFEELEK